MKKEGVDTDLLDTLGPSVALDDTPTQEDIVFEDASKDLAKAATLPVQPHIPPLHVYLNTSFTSAMAASSLGANRLAGTDEPDR